MREAMRDVGEENTSEAAQNMVMRMRKRKGITASKRVLLILLIVSVLVIIAVISRLLDLPLPLGRRSQRDIRRLGKTWTWSCESGRCLRRPWPGGVASTSPWTSLPRCQTLCTDTGPPLWPKPTGPWSCGRHSSVFHLHHVVYKIHRGVDASNALLLKDAFNIFKSNLVALVPDEDLDVSLQPSQALLRVSVFLRGQSETYLSLNTSESYRLSVAMRQPEVVTAEIVAQNFFGARHALETLSQLIWWETDDNLLGAYRVLDSIYVEDAPRFAYRGIMIDVARNFMPIAVLKKVIVGMAASKLNALHLHLTDSQSFPFESESYPQMSRHGAYSPDQVYTGADMRSLTEFARVRGVRLLPEIDAPSHSAAGWTWGEAEGLGKLAVCVDRQPWQQFCGEPPCGQLNPTNNNTFLVLRGLYKNLVESTKLTDLFHVGGDEVNLLCWADEVHKNVSSFSREVYHEMLTNFHQRARQEVLKVKRISNIVVWSTGMKEEEYLKTFPPDQYVIEEWGSSEWPDTAMHLRHNYRVILAHVDAWYLDCGFGNWIPGANEACSPVSTWQKVYFHQPWARYTAAEVRRVLGGEVCLWSERVDAVSLEARVWPRAAALAERLWTDEAVATDVRDVTVRMAVQRQRLMTRGVNADVIWPRWCDENPTEC